MEEKNKPELKPFIGKLCKRCLDPLSISDYLYSYNNEMEIIICKDCLEGSVRALDNITSLRK